MYERRFDVELPGIGRIDIDKVMLTIGGAVAAGVGLDMAVSRAVGRWKDASARKDENQSGKES